MSNGVGGGGLLEKKSYLDKGDVVGAMFFFILRWHLTQLTIKVSNKCSSFVSCTVGVPQGSSLSPIMFSL